MNNDKVEEVIDECGSTLGYVPICRNINKKCKNM